MDEHQFWVAGNLTSLMACTTSSDDTGLSQTKTTITNFLKHNFIWYLNFHDASFDLETWRPTLICRWRAGRGQRVELDAPCSEPWCSLSAPAAEPNQPAAFSRSVLILHPCVIHDWYGELLHEWSLPPECCEVPSASASLFCTSPFLPLANAPKLQHEPVNLVRHKTLTELFFFSSFKIGKTCQY